MICDREFTDELTASLRHLRAFGSGLCRDASRIDDLVQQTALQAWAARHQFRAEGSLKSWLFTILRNCYFRELHGRRCEVEDPNGAIAGSVAMPAEHDGHCQLADLDRAVQALPNVQREALTLVVLDGLSYKEAGQICMCKEGTVKSRVARARQDLRLLDGSSDDSSPALGRRRLGAAVRPALGRHGASGDKRYVVPRSAGR
jgi:RNA polymerase sigma-70 factor (ECF subfamily)